jgi:hypothetical protein
MWPQAARHKSGSFLEISPPICISSKSAKCIQSYFSPASEWMKLFSSHNLHNTDMKSIAPGGSTLQRPVLHRNVSSPQRELSGQQEPLLHLDLYSTHLYMAWPAYGHV